MSDAVAFALKKIKPNAFSDLEHFLSAFPTQILLRVEQVKGSSGGATGQTEYVGYALPGTLKAQPGWMIFKNVYDSAGFQTQKLFANGTANFDKVFDSGSSEYATYTYTTS